ncbi:MAG: S24 family peptidase [Roseimicrobium sp.]
MHRGAMPAKSCMPGDTVIVMPDEEPRSGCLVVAKLKDDGVILRSRARLHGGGIKLIAYNPLYPAEEYLDSDFHWIYPVHSTAREEWS